MWSLSAIEPLMTGLPPESVVPFTAFPPMKMPVRCTFPCLYWLLRSVSGKNEVMPSLLPNHTRSSFVCMATPFTYSRLMSPLPCM